MNIIGNIYSDTSFYLDKLPLLQNTASMLLDMVESINKNLLAELNRDIIEHCKYRIKSTGSVTGKLKRRNLPVTPEAAVNGIHDAVGVRIICTFTDDIYLVAENIRKCIFIDVVSEKDYIKFPKPNGYRSYHLIVYSNDYGTFAEIQIRTIAMDCWASLEHQLKYKKDIPEQDMIIQELKRCADEMASTDLTMQTIRDILCSFSDSGAGH